MSVTISEVVAEVSSLVAGTVGPDDIGLTGVAPLGQARAGQLTFCRDPDADLSADAPRLRGCAVFVPEALAGQAAHLDGVALIVSTNPRLAFMRAMRRFFAPPLPAAGVHAAAVVAPGAAIHPSASIGAGCFVGAEVSVGEGTVIYPNVAIYCPATIGAKVKVHAGTVIGADGFGYERSDDGVLESFPHAGGVVIEDEVEIGANSCIDRGTLGDTWIGRGAKIDNLVHISHNVRIGAQAVVIANSMIGGSAQIGEGAWVAPSAGVLNQKRVGAGATVGFGALVVSDVPAGEVVMGAPAVPRERFRGTQAAIRRLVDGAPNAG